MTFRILYVDDEPALLDLGKIFLEQSGSLSVDTVSSVEDAIERIKTGSYDGIISDYQMPGKDGLDFLKYIRGKNSDIPFILFTGRGREEIVIDALNSGADFYLQKGGEHKSQFVELEHKIKNAIERKRIQDRLRESEQRMSGIINFLPDATFAVNLDRKVIAWNKTLETMTGVLADAVLGTSGYSGTLTADREKRPPLVDLVLNKDKEIEKKSSGIQRDGDRVISETYMPGLYGGKGAYVWRVASPLYDSRGSMVGAIEALRDITQRKESEEQLRQMNEDLHAAYEQLAAAEEELRANYDELSRSERELQQTKDRYRSVVEDQNELICRFAPDGRLTFVNDAYCRYFGLSRAACLEEQHHVEIPAEERPLVRDHLRSLTKEDPSGSIEHRILMSNGKIRWQRWNDRAIFDPEGRLVEYQSVGRDITRRKEAEDELQRMHEDLYAAYEQLAAAEEELQANYDELSRRERELQQTKERYQSVVEDQTEFICRFTPDGRLTFVNDAYCRYFGLSRAACLEEQHHVEIPAKERALVRNLIQSLTRDEPSGSIEHRIIMPNGKIRWQHWNDRAIFDPEGRLIEFQSVGRDITRQKEAEEALIKKTEELHAAYEQLTAVDEELRASFEELTHQEKTIRASAKQFAEIIDFLPDATFVIDQQGKVIAWNQAIETLSGISKRDMLGKDNYEYACWLYHQRSPILIDLVLRYDPKTALRYPVIKKNGDQLIAEVHIPHLHNGRGGYLWFAASSLYDPDGNITGAIESIREITDHKLREAVLNNKNEELASAYEELTASEEELRQQVEEIALAREALKASEERYRNVIEDQTEFISRFTPDGNHVFVNEAYCRYFGISREDVLGHNFRPKIHPGDKERVDEFFTSFTPSSPAGSIEHRIVMPDGSVRWLSWSDRAIFNPEGRLLEYQSVGRDITHRKEADEELKRTHEDLHAAYEQLAAAEEELRANYDELNKNQELLHRSEERYRTIVEDQTEFICRFTPDGTITFANEAYCRYFGTPKENLVGKRFAPNIPEEDQNTLRNHFHELSLDNPVRVIEHRIAMPDGDIRWHQWSDRAIFDAAGRIIEYQSVGRDITDRKRMEWALNESNQKLNLLSSITRHDILNQLTALQGYHLLLSESLQESDQKRWITGAIKAAETIQSQIQFTRQYQDIGLQKPRWQNVFTCAHTVARDHGFSQVSVDHALSEIEIFADPLLKTVFYNLFENAKMHGGDVRHIRVTGDALPSLFRIIIEDDGNGIDTSLKEKIFYKGFGKHTGLGLFLVREVLSITSLSIREVGEPGKGARFEILVPCDMTRPV